MKKTFENIIFKEQDGIWTITLNRPEVLNALSPNLFDDITLVLDEAKNSETVKVLVITGAGPAFCAGGDVKNNISKLSTMSPFEIRNYMHAYVAKKIVELEKPVIAAINGIVTGGGLDMALACDIRFASEKARFSEIFVKIGLIPDMGGVYFLPRLIGLSKAKLLAFTGDMIDSQEAARIGLVDKVFPDDQLMPAVERLARQLASGPTKTIAMIKLAMNRSLSMDLNSSLDYTTNLQCFIVQTEDHKEAFKAFLEKRKPIFKGR